MMNHMYRKAAAGILAAGILAKCAVPLLASGGIGPPVNYNDLVVGKDYVAVYPVEAGPDSIVVYKPSDPSPCRILSIYDEKIRWWTVKKVEMFDLFTGALICEALADCEFYELL
mgnify:FL=1